MVVLPLVWRNYCPMTKMLCGSANNRPSHSQQLPIEERQYEKETGRNIDFYQFVYYLGVLNVANNALMLLLAISHSIIVLP
jgi:hypothetical protein